jgi:rRNA small subunit pseudouridine methyltransferase Nep1
MVGVEDRNEDVTEEEAPGPSSVPDAAAPAPVPAPSAEDGGVIFVLEKASLEAAKVGKNYQLLNCDDHATFLKKHKRDPALYRPDILHQVCLHLEISGSNPKLS